MRPEISVVIPTHNRCPQVTLALQSLARQTVAPERYEVVAVADGCRDDTLAALASLTVPYCLTVIEQPGRGAAAARNQGAAAATSSLLLFLDDDMEAEPGLIEAHLDAHARHPDGVVLGRFPILDPGLRASVFEVATKAWWDQQFAARGRAEHRYTFRDFCTGNVSLPKRLFDAAGGFDEAFSPRAAGEDYDLGIRLLQRGTRFRYVPEAASIHHDGRTASRALARARQEGFGHVLLVRKHPELFDQLWLEQLSQVSSCRLLRPLVRCAWRWPGIFAPMVWPLRIVHRTAQATGAVEWLRWTHDLLHVYHYWQGAREATGSFAAWEELHSAARDRVPDFREVELDLAVDLPRLETILAQTPTDAAVLKYREWTLGRIDPPPGAEALRPIHVHAILVHHYAPAFLALQCLDGMLQPAPAPPRATCKRLEGHRDACVDRELSLTY